MLRESGANFLKILICLRYSDFFHSSNRWIYNVVFKYHALVKLSPKINYVFVLDNAPNAFPGHIQPSTYETSICYAVEDMNKCTIRPKTPETPVTLADEGLDAFSKRPITNETPVTLADGLDTCSNRPKKPQRLSVTSIF